MESSSVLEIVRMIGGSIAVLFLPGFALSYIFFLGRSIDAIERFALSFALSITVVPLLGFYLNLLGVKISTLSVLGISTSIVVGSGVYLYLKNIYFGHQASVKAHTENKENSVSSSHVVNLRARRELLTNKMTQIVHTAKKVRASIPRPISKYHILSREIFQILLVGYMILTVAEVFRPGVVSNFFTMSYLLVTVLIFGVVMVLTEPQKEEGEGV